MELKKHLQSLFLASSFILLSGLKMQAQEIYATSTSEVSSGNYVDNTSNAGGANGAFATVRSYGGVSAGIGAYSGALKLEFTDLVPANTTTYIKVDGEDNGLFDSLLGGSLGALLSSEAETATFGDHYVEVTALDASGTSVAFGRTDNLTSSRTLKIVRNKDGDVFIVITPKAAYKSLILKDITDTSLLGTENFTNVYHAFYLNTLPIICNSEGIFTSYDGTGITLDLLSTGATGVRNPEFAIDRDSTTYATISVGIVSTLASMYQDIEFLTTASDKDRLEITLSTQEGSLLNAALLQNIQIELFKEELIVYSAAADAADTVTIQPAATEGTYIITVNSGIEFDRLRLTLSSPAGVNLAQQINLFSTKITTAPPIINEGGENQTFCSANIPKVSDLIASATGTLVWYQQAIGGAPYAMTDTLLDGNTYYASNFNGSCEGRPRLSVSVSLRDLAPPEGNPLQSFCKLKKAIIADLKVSASGEVTWYEQATGGNTYASEDALQQGQQYYAANSDGICESSIRLEVTVEITDVDAPEGDTSQNFCSETTPTISNLEATANGTIIWYDQENGGNEYAAGTPLVNETQYYAANSDGTCESSERLTVIVTIKDPSTPTTNSTNQNFCKINTPKIADLKATASGTIIWYDQENGGTKYTASAPLVDGLQYYAANSDGICESSERLTVIITIKDPSTPTTSSTNQNFCKINTPKIADLKATASGTIIWYDQENGGTKYAADTPLVNETQYYAANSDGTCESSERLTVIITIKDPSTPTTSSTNQNFCKINTPKIADLKATASGTIIWYDQENGGTKYAASTPLVDGLQYYAANSDGTCESTNRLEVIVSLTDPEKPTGNSSQNFCSNPPPNPTIANLEATASGTIIWYDQENGGNEYAAGTPLVNETQYYAANSDGTCESSERLTVIVTIKDPSTPTTNSTNQNFCKINTPKIADLKATASGTIIWYDQENGGTKYAASTPLVDGLQYYAANSDGTCESTNRLEVIVSLTDPEKPTGNSSQNFCSNPPPNPTIANLEATASGTIIWYDQENGGNEYAAGTPLVNETQYYAANSDGTCESSTRLELTVIIKNTEDIKIKGNTAEICFGTREIYEVPNGLAPYAWSVVGGEIISGGTSTDNIIEVVWDNLINTAVSVEITGGCFNSNKAELAIGIVTCSDLTIQKKVDIIKPSFGDTVLFTILIENSSLSVFKDLQIRELLSNGFIYKSKSTTLGNYDENSGIWNIPNFGANQSATLTIEAEIHTTGSYLNTAEIIDPVPEDTDTTNNTAKILVTPLCLKIYNTITPNGDGMNDYFVISCIENFPNTMIEIYDRYGSIIYKKKNYRNDFNGVANQTSKIIKTGEKLPNGTYFFILKMNDANTKDKKSYIQIIK